MIVRFPLSYILPILPLLVLEGRALACGTCALDQGSSGQTLMLVSMLALPVVAGSVGVLVIRRLLRTGESGAYEQ